MKSELLFYAQVGMYTGRKHGLPAFPLAARCEKGSECPHEDCWAAVMDPEEFFGVLGLSNVPDPGLWIAEVEYIEEQITSDDSDEDEWEHLQAAVLWPVTPAKYQEIAKEIWERAQQETKEFPSNLWRWL
jgi:hypothetical protein